MIIDLRTQELRKAPVGTIVITSKGFEFELIERSDKGKETWLDKISKLKWFDIEDEKMNYFQAMDRFNSEAKRLPTTKEFQDAEDRGFREVLPNMSDYWFWSASVHPNVSGYAHVFNGYNGYIHYVYRDNYYYSVRCVGR